MILTECLMMISWDNVHTENRPISLDQNWDIRDVKDLIGYL